MCLSFSFQVDALIRQPFTLCCLAQDPMVHSGVAACVSSTVAHTALRDVLAEHGCLCVQSEADGVAATKANYIMIFGLQNYADSHAASTTEQWIGYSAAVAAAYLRCLLDARHAIQ
jgi:hypothetical protein